MTALAPFVPTLILGGIALVMICSAVWCFATSHWTNDRDVGGIFLVMASLLPALLAAWQGSVALAMM